MEFFYGHKEALGVLFPKTFEVLPREALCLAATCVRLSISLIFTDTLMTRPIASTLPRGVEHGYTHHRTICRFQIRRHVASNHDTYRESRSRQIPFSQIVGVSPAVGTEGKVHPSSHCDVCARMFLSSFKQFSIWIRGTRRTRRLRPYCNP